MADIVKINKNIQYQTNSVLYGLLAGETKPLEFINKNFASHIIDAYLKDGTFELFPSNEENQKVPVLGNTDIDLKPVQEIEQPAFEIVYKTTQPIQDKDGNEIEVGSQFAESELKELIAEDKRQSKKKIKELLQDEKLIEIKKLSQ
jgi:hypothetical protein